MSELNFINGPGFKIGLVLGIVIAMVYSGYTFRDVITSGDAFNLGEQFYRCRPVEFQVK